MSNYDFQIGWHDGSNWPDWGSAPRKPLVDFDMTHRGEWLTSVIGKDPRTGENTIYHILKCEICVSIHAWPLPCLEDLATYYQREFFQHEKPDYLDRYDEDRGWWETCVHGPLLDTAATYRLQNNPGGIQRMQVLEVGAGPGIALDVAAQYGWGTYAVEPSPVCAARLRQRGHTVYEGTLEGYAEAVAGFQRQFDIVYLYEVLEHQPNPYDFLDTCRQLTKPGGILVVCVPNDASPIQYDACQRLGIGEYWWAPPQHLHYYSPKMLQLVVRWSGWDVLDIRGTFPMELFLLGGRNYVGNPVVGREIHAIRMKNELESISHGTWNTRIIRYRDEMERHRYGREIVLLARKPYE